MTAMKRAAIVLMMFAVANVAAESDTT